MVTNIIFSILSKLHVETIPENKNGERKGQGQTPLQKIVRRNQRNEKVRNRKK